MNTYQADLAIIGGGLAGLTYAIEMRRKGFEVCLVEQKTYPFHKVCGEYISNESRAYLAHLGIDLNKEKAANINALEVTTHKHQLQANLPLGGFGISRYTLDSRLRDIAVAEGVNLLEGERVEAMEELEKQIRTPQSRVKARLILGAYGKRSNLDRLLKRKHMQQAEKRPYVAVKYHIQADYPQNTIGLHLFKGGYCGVSKIEADRYCMCYLMSAELFNSKQGITEIEESILKQNPHLAPLVEAKRFYDKPLTISNLYFGQKQKTESGLLMMGDAAGLIAPLCCNGMSMAMHAAYQLSSYSEQCLAGSLSEQQLKQQYQAWWNKHFGLRLQVGYHLQELFYREGLTNGAIKLLNRSPFFLKRLIQLTHGKPFFKQG
jgi:flavin-dependent dehydrogenase